jgi:hypothetical protein
MNKPGGNKQLILLVGLDKVEYIIIQLVTAKYHLRNHAHMFFAFDNF